MSYGVRPKFVHGQADLLGCLRVQLQVGPFNENRIVTQIMEGSELGSDKLSNIRAEPIAFHEEIVSVTKRTEAPAEAGIEVIETFRLSNRYWPISAAIPIASLSPVAGSSRSPTGRCASPGRTTDRAASPR